MTVWDKVGRPLSVGSLVQWNKQVGTVVSLTPAFVRVRRVDGTVFTRKPFRVVRAA